jgi:hypothetical protein
LSTPFLHGFSKWISALPANTVQPNLKRRREIRNQEPSLELEPPQEPKEEKKQAVNQWVDDRAVHGIAETAKHKRDTDQRRRLDSPQR